MTRVVLAKWDYLGVYAPDYFQGYGTAYNYVRRDPDIEADCVCVGIGGSVLEAYRDAVEQIATSDLGSDRDAVLAAFAEIETEIEDEDEDETEIETEIETEDVYQYVGVAWSVVETDDCPDAVR